MKYVSFMLQKTKNSVEVTAPKKLTKTLSENNFPEWGKEFKL